MVGPQSCQVTMYSRSDNMQPRKFPLFSVGIAVLQLTYIARVIQIRHQRRRRRESSENETKIVLRRSTTGHACKKLARHIVYIEHLLLRW